MASELCISESPHFINNQLNKHQKTVAPTDYQFRYKLTLFHHALTFNKDIPNIDRDHLFGHLSGGVEKLSTFPKILALED